MNVAREPPRVAGQPLQVSDEFPVVAHPVIPRPAVEGTLMTFSPDPRKNPAAADVVKRFKDKGIEPEGYVLYTYAAIQAWKQA